MEFPRDADAVRDPGERFKYIYYHGLWDKNGFYDLRPIRTSGTT